MNSSPPAFGKVVDEVQRGGPRESRTGSSRAGRFVMVFALVGLGGCQGCQSEPPVEPVAEQESASDAEPQQMPDRAEIEQPSDEAPGEPPAPPSAESVASGRAEEGTDGESAAGAAPAAGPAQSREEALADARRLHRQSQSAQANGNYGVAFREASSAWSALQPFRSDPECGALCDTIEAELKELGPAANRQVKERSFGSRTLIEK